MHREIARESPEFSAYERERERRREKSMRRFFAALIEAVKLFHCSNYPIIGSISSYSVKLAETSRSSEKLAFSAKRILSRMQTSRDERQSHFVIILVSDFFYIEQELKLRKERYSASCVGDAANRTITLISVT